MVVVMEDDYLAHYGILRRSGRYPWGSGGTVEARNNDFLGYVAGLRKEGMTEAQIAKGVGMSTGTLRDLKSNALARKKQNEIRVAQQLRNKGMSLQAIGDQLGGRGESYVRTLLKPGAEDKANILSSTTNMLKKQVEEKKYVDIGEGVETQLGLSKDKLRAAVTALQEQGYVVRTFKEKQITQPHDTEYKVLAKPGTSQREVWENRAQVQQIIAFSTDGGRSFSSGKIHPPIAINPNRVGIKYKEDGGDREDGMIYVRRGVEDISLGSKPYAQVRVQVGEGHYIKGMAMYRDDLPKGTDLLFCTPKPRGTNKLDVMKPLESDPELPFGSIVRQLVADPGTPHERVTSAMNIVGYKEGSGEEGSWGKWKRVLASQFLSKQPLSLAKSQLNTTYERRKKELDEINALTNPAVKKKLLQSFADSTDAAAVQLHAAHLPRQGWHVLLPVDTMKPTEIYAPGFRPGEKVVLIRYPHAGPFEIPLLTVNNNHPDAKRLLGNARDAVGIHHSVAKHLSGADFDGDAVLVIPNNLGRVKIAPQIESLKNFDTMIYKQSDDVPPIPKPWPRKQQEMGSISNLITDMTIKGASHEKIARAVRHSMVVIDAEKHNLDFRASAQQNGIAQLKREYQAESKRHGASTLISRATSQKPVPERIPRPQSKGGPIDKTTGRKVFVETGRMIKTRTGKEVPKTIRVQRLADTEDAFTLSSGTQMENVYAEHSNKMKGLANQARLSLLKAPSMKTSASAKRVYANEVKSLDDKLSLVRMNRPLERQARLLASAEVRARRQANPHLDASTIKKIETNALNKARVRTGAHKSDVMIKITDKEWEAIQAGAISNYKMTQIMTNTDLQALRARATPRPQRLMTSAKTSQAKALLARGYTRAEVADRLGVSLTTLDTATSE